MKFNDKLYAFIVENTFTTLPEIGRELFNGIPGVTFLPDIFFKNQVGTTFWQYIRVKIKLKFKYYMYISFEASTKWNF